MAPSASNGASALERVPVSAPQGTGNGRKPAVDTRNEPMPPAMGAMRPRTGVRAAARRWPMTPSWWSGSSRCALKA